MTAESMLFNGAILCVVLVLGGLAWGFLLLKIQGGEAEQISRVWCQGLGKIWSLKSIAFGSERQRNRLKFFSQRTTSWYRRVANLSTGQEDYKYSDDKF